MLSGAVLDTGSGGGGNGPAIFTKGIISALPNIVSGASYGYQIPFSQGIGPWSGCSIVNTSCDIPSASASPTTPNNSYSITNGGFLSSTSNISATVENDFFLISYQDNTSTTYSQNYAAYNGANHLKIITPSNLGFITQGNTYSSGNPLATIQAAGNAGTLTWSLVTSFNGLTYPFTTNTGNGNTWAINASTGAITGTATNTGVNTIAVQVSDGTNTATEVYNIGVYQYVTGAPRPAYNPASGTSGGVNCGPGFFTLNGELYESNGTLFRINHTWAATFIHVITISTPWYNAMGINATRQGPESDAYNSGSYPELASVGNMITQHSNHHRFWWCGRWYTYVADGNTQVSGSTSFPLMGTVLKEWVGAIGAYTGTGANGLGNIMNQIGINIANEYGPYNNWGVNFLNIYAAAQAPITGLTATTITFSGTSPFNSTNAGGGIGYVYIKGATWSSTNNDGLYVVSANGTNTLTGTFPSGYVSGGTVWAGAVGIMRAAGYYCPLFITASGGDSGGPPTDITNYGATIIASDPLQSIVWDYHTYYTGGTDSTSQSGFESQTLALLNTQRLSTGAPFVSGEVGIYYADGRQGSPVGGQTTDIPMQKYLQSFNKYGTAAHGWVAYSASAVADSNLGYIRYNPSSSLSDTSDAGYPTSFTVQGKRIVLDPIYGSIVSNTGGTTSF